MFHRCVQFLSSFGIMALGVFLILGNSVHVRVAVPIHSFPVAKERSVSAVGGDVDPVVFFPKPIPTVPLPKNSAFSFPTTTAAAALVTDDKTGTVLFGEHEDEPRPLASITKLMSALVLLDSPPDWSATTTIIAADIDQDNHVAAGESFTFEDVWHIALIGSSNSAINVLVRNSGLTQAEFVARMNAKAEQLHLSSVRFVEPTGLDARNVATAKDIDELLKVALSQEKIASTLRIGEFYAQPLDKTKLRRVWSTNWLLTRWIPNNFDRETMAGKTGYITLSGYNFAVRLSDTHHHALRIVVLGAPTNESRFTEAKNLAQWTTEHYLWPDDPGYAQLVDN